MTLIIEDPEIDRLADEVAKLTGESPTEVLRKALVERLERERHEERPRQGVAEKLNALARECAALPDYDTRSPDEIIGYDEHGLPS
jgi:antitoxin VapB